MVDLAVLDLSASSVRAMDGRLSELMSPPAYTFFKQSNCKQVQSFAVFQDIRTKLAAEGKSCNNLQVSDLDLSSLKSVKQFCSQLRRSAETVNYLILNAGLFGQDNVRKITEDGLEEHFQVMASDIFMFKLASEHCYVIIIVSISKV